MNLVSYVKQFGHKSFSELPFNDIDGLILSQLSYVNFHLITPESGFIKLKSIKGTPQINNQDFYYGSVDAKNNKRLLKLCVNCKRFRNVEVGYPKGDFDASKNKQFYACTFLMPHNIGFISFRGTDITMVGWREDLYIAYRDTIPGQEDAVSYLKTVTKLFQGNFYVGGHSKGGNLAIYACLNMYKKLYSRLIKCYSYDGPGFKDTIKQHPNYELLRPMVAKFLTSNDMIGVIYNNVDNAKIVYSTGILLGGHDPFRWMIDFRNVDFAYAKDRSFMSKKYEEALMNWLKEVDDEDKRIAVHVIFEMMGDSKNVYDLLLKGGRLILNGKKTWDEYTPQQRIKARETFKKLGKYFLSAYSPKRFLKEKFAIKSIEEKTEN